MTRFRMRLRRLLLLPLFLGFLGLNATAQEPAPDAEVGRVSVTKPKKEVAAADLTPVERIAAGLAGSDLDWRARYRRDCGKDLTSEARLTLAVAREPGYSRKQCTDDLSDRGEATKKLITNIDVGRHDLMKAIYARAFVEANQRLAKEKRSPLKRVLTLNSGGTGDYTRDQDITAFAGDETTEKIYFDCIAKVGREMGLTVDVKDTGGIDFPQIEVTVFPGGNDLPDPRFQTDPKVFQLDYVKGIGKQLADPEAYIGGGADVEVIGRRRPGQVHAQAITAGKDGGVHYHSQDPGNPRETRALFTRPARERFDNWQLASHIFNDLMQGWRHKRHGGPETKGPLKYAGRAAEKLCQIHGKGPWVDLPMDEKVELMAKLLPQHDAKSKGGRRILEKMAKAVDVADTVARTKKLPAGADGRVSEKIALIFLRKATAATAGEMAKDMLKPPPFDKAWLPDSERARWDAMTPDQRDREAAKKNRVYRECVSVAAMENLVLTMAMLRQMDQSEGRATGTLGGEGAIRQMIETADPKTRPILTDVAEYSKVYLELNQTRIPEAREAARKQLVDVRKRLSGHLGGDTPGTRLLANMEKLGPDAYLKAEIDGGPTPMGRGMAEVKARFAEHMRDAFPSTMQEYRGFRASIQKRGVKGYVAKKLVDEVCQLDTLSDALTIIEMYQGNAGAADYGKFLVTNVLSRFHWSFSHLIGAAQVSNEEQLKDLGKNVVFATLARVVPWAATAKVTFDIARGIVTVTVGYSINVVNADLVDAMYTGEAGHRGSGPPMKIRASGFSILDENFVKRRRDEKTSEEILYIDRPAVYRHFFRQWTGLAPEDRRRAMPPAGLARAHDKLVAILVRQAAKYDRTWVSASAVRPRVLRLTGVEVEKAIRDVNRELAVCCRKDVTRLLSESAVRSYRSYGQKKDSIEEGLVARFTADMLTGLLEHWETWLTAQVIAMRDIERTAMQADLRAAAAELRRQSDAARRMRPAPGTPVEFECRVDFSLSGLRIPDSVEFDGAEPVRIRAWLAGRGDVGEHPSEVTFAIDTVDSEFVHKAGKREGVIEPGDVVRHRFLVRAHYEGKEIASRGGEYVVRMPPPAESNSVPLLKHEVKRRDGTVRQRFTYVKPFFGMPDEWEQEDGFVYHGKYEGLQPDGTLREQRDYEFGRLNGEYRSYDSKGRVNRINVYRDGKRQGVSKRLDPDSAARLELEYADNVLVEQRSYWTTGQLLRKITYRPSGKSPRWNSGEAKAWWPSGTPRWHGAYADTDIDLNSTGGYDGEGIPGKTGTWEWFHESGTPGARRQYVAGLLDGPTEEWSEEGHPVCRGRFSKGKTTGVWQRYHENGKLRSKGMLEDDRKQGVWEFFNRDGTKDRRETYVDNLEHGPSESWFGDGKLSSKGDCDRGYRQGEWVIGSSDGSRSEGTLEKGRKEGEWTAYFANGKVSTIGGYRDDNQHGDWKSYRENGRLEWTGTFRDGRSHGRFEFYDEKGKRESWIQYDDGDEVDSGRYEDD